MLRCRKFIKNLKKYFLVLNFCIKYNNKCVGVLIAHWSDSKIFALNHHSCSAVLDFENDLSIIFNQIKGLKANVRLLMICLCL